MIKRKIPFYLFCIPVLYSMGLNATTLTVNSNSDAAFATGGTGVATTGDLRYVLNFINQTPDTYDVVFSLGSGNETISLQGMLPILNTNATNTLNINGNNIAGSGAQVTISGGGSQRGFIAQQGPITIQNLSIENTVANGGNGGNTSGGGGMGAGSGLFVNQAQVVLSNVNFSNNKVTGGSGAAISGNSGGGGGMGGDGGALGFAGGGGLGANGGSDLLSTNPAGGGGIAPGGFGGTGGGAGQAGGAFGSASAGNSASGSLGGINGGGGGSGAAAINGAGGGGIGGGNGTALGGGSGGFGGGGGGGVTGGFGGDGGFGGGGGSNHGDGGFGGGGASNGNGGFGGGGGGGLSIPGVGGVGGGQGALAGGGGGGMGAGGAVFVNSGAGGTVQFTGNATIDFGNATAGSGQLGGTNGAAAGTEIFATTGSAPLSFIPAAGQTITVAGTIADDSFNSLPGPNYTSGFESGVGILKQGAGTLILRGDNTFSGGIELDGGILQIDRGNALGNSDVALEVVGNSTLRVEDDIFSDRRIDLDADLTIDSNGNFIDWFGRIEGDGALFKSGSGTLHLHGLNDYTGGTTVSAGTLKGDTLSLRRNITVNSVLEFAQEFAGDFDGTLFGSGIVEKTGQGILRFVTNNDLFTGTTNVRGGIFQLEAILGGDVNVFAQSIFHNNGVVLRDTTVQSEGLLTGHGRTNRDLFIRSRGGIAPGLNTYSVGRHYVQEADAVYFADFDLAGRSSLLNIGLTATLNPGSTLRLRPTNGVVVNKLHTILFGAGGLTGQFSNVILDSNTLEATVLYDATHVDVFFKVAFDNIAQTFNQGQISRLFSEFDLDVPSDIQEILQAFSTLNEFEARDSLDQISGVHYTNILLATELANRQFIRRIYDPLREIVTANPCAPAVYCTYKPTIDFWYAVSGGRSFLHGDRNARGFRLSDFAMTFGMQSSPFKALTLGAAYTYEKDVLSFRVGGNSHNNISLGGIYALYRPQRFYVFGDLNFGKNSSRVRRTIDIGDLHFRPRGNVSTYFGSLYLELGTDFGFHYALLQPFFAIETGTAKFSGFTESGGAPLALRINGNSRSFSMTRLGVHLSSAPLKWGTSMGMDFSWNYLASSSSNSVRERFLDFGSQFKIKGFHLHRNSFEITVFLNQNINKCWDIYFDADAMGWQNSFVYSFTGGVKYTW